VTAQTNASYSPPRPAHVACAVGFIVSHPMEALTALGRTSSPVGCLGREGTILRSMLGSVSRDLHTSQTSHAVRLMPLTRGEPE